MTNCPICATENERRFAPYPVYWQCRDCGLAYQSPMPPKTFIAGFEGDPANMSDGDRKINCDLAAHLFREAMGGKPGTALDIGAKLPVLAQALARLTGMRTAAIDPEIIPLPDVDCLALDFETMSVSATADRFDLITAVHFLEHCYDPCAALRKMRLLVANDGVLFLRLPQHDVDGIARDFTEGHVSIHPYIHCLQSILETLRRTNTFLLTDYRPHAGWGQADLFLRPI